MFNIENITKQYDERLDNLTEQLGLIATSLDTVNKSLSSIESLLGQLLAIESKVNNVVVAYDTTPGPVQ